MRRLRAAAALDGMGRAGLGCRDGNIRGAPALYLDVIELRDFYGSFLGPLVARHVGGAIGEVVSVGAGDRVLGFGFATPYLASLAAHAERALAFMPAQQGVIDWPPEGRSATALVEEDSLPLPDASIDVVILVHALELSPRPAELLLELRRVLTAAGRLAVVVPNRQGAWARSDISPFGHGRPYSRGQLRAEFNEAGFEARAWATALHMPPLASPSLQRLAALLERSGRVCWPAFAGVICVLATKRTVQVVRVRARRLLAPAMRPALPAGGGMARGVEPPARRAGACNCAGGSGSFFLSWPRAG
jgi:SAM-dependent methyltransferase